MTHENRLGIRVSNDLHSLVKTVSDARGESISTFLRRIVLEELARLSYLPAEQKKALGINTEGEDSVND